MRAFGLAGMDRDGNDRKWVGNFFAAQGGVNLPLPERPQEVVEGLACLHVWLLVGGGQYGDSGCFMEPTVFLNPKTDAEIYKEEIFGPVSVIRTFKTEEEVIELVNDTEYGLMNGVFTSDVSTIAKLDSFSFASSSSILEIIQNI